MEKFIYLLSQDQNDGYDTYDSCIVVATSEEEAKNITPNGGFEYGYGSWCSSPEYVKCVKVGIAEPSMLIGVVLSSYNAG